MEKDILELMKTRSSCRNFSKEKIPQQILKELQLAASLTPSSSGFQNYSVIQVTEPEIKARLAEVSMGQSFIAKAAVDFVFCIDLRRQERIAEALPSPEKGTANIRTMMTLIVDATISAQTLCLLAEQRGLRTVYVANCLNRIRELSEILHLPEYVAPAIMVCAGYSKGQGVLSGKYGPEILVQEEEYRDLPIEKLLEAHTEKYKTWKMKPEEKVVEQIVETTAMDKGDDFAEKVREKMQKSGKIDPYQYYYGYRYLKQPCDMKGFNDYKKFFEEQGFSWLGETEKL